MKKFLFASFLFITANMAIAQSSKQVQWSYFAKKISDKVYEVHLTATINGDYHLYAQDAGGEGPVATAFTFTKNPLTVFDGKIRENGKQIKKFETAWKHDVKYYESKVDFVQIVKLKANVKTSLAGKVEFMVCNDKQCLPPSEVQINVNIGG